MAGSAGDDTFAALARRALRRVVRAVVRLLVGLGFRRLTATSRSHQSVSKNTPCRSRLREFAEDTTRWAFLALKSFCRRVEGCFPERIPAHGYQRRTRLGEVSARFVLRFTMSECR